MSTVNDFIGVIKELIVFFEELTALEKQKLLDTQNSNLKGLEECMKKEQADVLKLKGLDRKRESLQNALSFGGLSFREILPLLKGYEQRECQALFSQLESTVESYKSISGEVNQELKSNLHMIDRAFANAEIARASNEMKQYAPDGQLLSKGNTGFTSRKV